jgi:hypothetical protein
VAAEKELVKAVVKLGFREPHVEEAIQHVSSKDAVLDW